MTLTLLNALLILIGPFLVVAPFAVATAVQFRPWRPSRFQFRMPTIRLELAW